MTAIGPALRRGGYAARWRWVAQVEADRDAAMAGRDRAIADKDRAVELRDISERAGAKLNQCIEAIRRELRDGGFPTDSTLSVADDVARALSKLRERTLMPGEQYFPNVKGCCPSCGGSSLFVGVGGHVTCGRSECSRPEAADQLLAGNGHEQTQRERADRAEDLVAEVGAWVASITGEHPTPELRLVDAVRRAAVVNAATLREERDHAREAADAWRPGPVPARAQRLIEEERWVHAVDASERTHVMFSGRARGYTDRPTFVIELVDGSRRSWVADLVVEAHDQHPPTDLEESRDDTVRRLAREIIAARDVLAPDVDTTGTPLDEVARAALRSARAIATADELRWWSRRPGSHLHESLAARALQLDPSGTVPEGDQPPTPTIFHVDDEPRVPRRAAAGLAAQPDAETVQLAREAAHGAIVNAGWHPDAAHDLVEVLVRAGVVPGAYPPGMAIDGDMLRSLITDALPRWATDEFASELADSVLDAAVRAGFTILHGPNLAPRPTPTPTHEWAGYVSWAAWTAGAARAVGRRTGELDLDWCSDEFGRWVEQQVARDAEAVPF